MAANCPDPPHKPVAPDDEDMSFIGGPDRTVMVQAPTELGPYRLTKLLGRGGMGEVWQAFDNNLERDVAVKLMRKELLANEEAVKRFAREARAVARLNHPNIVQVYTFGDQQGVLFFVMELVEGETITQRMKQCGAVRLHECVFMLLQAIEGLSYANARGIIHRDIKPSNLMLTPDFRIKIADFGLAKMIEHDTQMTAAGTTMGSPNYMSPEQARGEEADHRSDIYALGISLYQMLTGTLPFTAEQPISVLLKQIQEPLPEPVTLQALESGRVLDVLKKMTSKDPEQRYQTYGGLAAAISSLAPDVRVKGGHVSTTTMPTPDAVAAGANAAAQSPPPSPGTAVFGAEPQPGAAPAEAARTAATEPMIHGGATATAAAPVGTPTPTSPEQVQSVAADIGSTRTALPSTTVVAMQPARTVFFMIAAAAGTAAIVAIGAIWAFHHFQQSRVERIAERIGETGDRLPPRARMMAARLRAEDSAENNASTPAPTVSPAATPVASPSPTSHAAAPTAAVLPAGAQPLNPTPTASPGTQVNAAPAPAPGTETSVRQSAPVQTIATGVPVVFTPTPAPTAVVFSNKLIQLGGIGASPNTPVAIRSSNGQMIATLPAGSTLPYLRLEGQGESARHVVSYNGQPAYIAFTDGQPLLAGTGAAPTSASSIIQLVLGTKGAGANEKVPVYRDKSILHPMTEVAAGTEVTLLDSDDVMLHVQIPGGKQGWILKGSATRKP